jgi:hypothetical protein
MSIMANFPSNEIGTKYKIIYISSDLVAGKAQFIP